MIETERTIATMANRITYQEDGRSASGVILELSRTAVVFMASAKPRYATFQVHGHSRDTEANFTAQARLLSAVPVTVHGAMWVRVTCGLVRDLPPASKPARTPVVRGESQPSPRKASVSRRRPS